MSAKLENQASSEAAFMSFVKRQWTKPKTLPENIQLTNQVAIVTGSNSGLGFEACRQLLQLGLAHLILAVRSQARGDAAAKTLRSEFSEATLSVWLLEMESYESIQAITQRCESLPRIDIAILNAGVQKPSFTTVAATGHEMTMQVDYLSTMLLAILLLPVLRTKKAASFPKTPVLSIVGSDMAYMTDIDVTSEPILKQYDDPKKFSQYPTYSKAKLLLQFAVTKLAEFADPDDVLVNITNPGMTKGTQIARDCSWLMAKSVAALNAMLGRTMQVAASNYVWSTVILGKESHGAFTSDWDIKP